MEENRNMNKTSNTKISDKEMKWQSIIIYSIILLIISAFTTPLIHKFIPCIRFTNQNNSVDTFVFILTLIVAVLTFLIAAIGIFEFDRIRKYTEKVDSFKEVLESFDNLLEEHEKEFNLVKDSSTMQEQYLKKTIEYLYSASYSNINLMKEEKQAKKLLIKLFHDDQIAKLYRASLDSNETTEIDKDKFAAFVYLEQNGTLDDIKHLEYVVEHDTNKKNCARAHEIKGRIKERFPH